MNYQVDESDYLEEKTVFFSKAVRIVELNEDNAPIYFFPNDDWIVLREDRGGYTEELY